MPFSVFRSPALTAANGVGVAINAALIGTYFFLTLYLQGPGDYSPLRTGFAFLPIGLSTFVGSLTSTRLVRHLGVRLTILLGTAIGTTGLLWLATALTAHVAYGMHLLGPLILFGFGAGSAVVPLTMAATHDVPAHQAGLASGLINTSRQMGRRRRSRRDDHGRSPCPSHGYGGFSGGVPRRGRVPARRAIVRRGDRISGRPRGRPATSTGRLTAMTANRPQLNRLKENQ